MRRLQGSAYHAKKNQLIPVAYSTTKRGNICLYYKGGFKHYLNDHEKATFQPNGLKEYYRDNSSRNDN